MDRGGKRGVEGRENTRNISPGHKYWGPPSRHGTGAQGKPLIVRVVRFQHVDLESIDRAQAIHDAESSLALPLHPCWGTIAVPW